MDSSNTLKIFVQDTVHIGVVTKPVLSNYQMIDFVESLAPAQIFYVTNQANAPGYFFIGFTYGSF